MKQMICLSNEPWSQTPGRTQHLLTRLKDVQILYFSPACGMLDRSWHQPGRTIRPGITVYTLPPVPEGEARAADPFALLQRRQARFLLDRLGRHRFRRPLLWTTSPEHVRLLDCLDYDGLVYDCDREWDDLPDLWEGSLARAADVVFAASPGLAERLSPCSANIVLLPNGVNFPLFDRQNAAAPRAPFARVSGPLLGWSGTVYRDLDLSPVLFAAQMQPDWTFLLLGRREENPLLPRLARLPNVILQDPCPLVEVPDYLQRCHLLIDLLRESRPYCDVISPRLYEYLSTGKPIVSMLWPEQVECFPDVVYGAHSPEAFVRLCGQALAEDRTWVCDRRRDYGAAAAWPNRAAEVARILVTAGFL